MCSYLDLLTYDNMEFILNYLKNILEIDIILAEKKIKKLSISLNELSIIKYLYDEYEYIDNYLCKKKYNISFKNIVYGIDKYLFSSINEEYPVILISIFDDFFGGVYNPNVIGNHFVSKKIYKPSYFKIIEEANKAILTTSNYHHIYLEGINHIPHDKVFDYIGLTP